MTSTESTSGNLDWSSLLGTTLEGGYQLDDLLQGDDRSASFRVRVLGDFKRQTLANFYQASGDVAEQQVALWKTVREIRHPNLSVPLGTGSLSLQSSKVIYVVLDKPDQTLGQALSKRTLETEEADQILSSSAGALAALHARRLVHGCVSPDEVFAFGESIKLSADSVRKIDSAAVLEVTEARYLAPESASQNVTPAADVWCLGATLLEALTRKKCAGPDCREDAATVAEPLGRILKKLLDPDPAHRARLADLEKLRAGEFVKEIAAAAVPVAVAAAPQADSTAAEQELTRIERRRSVAPEGSGQRAFHKSRTWVYAAVVLIVVVWLLWAGRPKHPVVPAGPVKPAATAAARGTGPATAWQTRTLSPDGAAASHRDVHPDARIARPAKPALGNPADPAVWRVVLYTFGHETDAQKRAQAINAQHPGLDAQTFSPAHSHMYLVVAGGPMTREDAARLRSKALRQGMPRDSYIQNYKQ
jgi:hypothetical protein